MLRVLELCWCSLCPTLHVYFPSFVDAPWKVDLKEIAKIILVQNTLLQH